MVSKLIGIIGGKGIMGKYFADFFEKNGYEVIISDKRTKLTNIQLAKKADVVIVSVPIDVTEQVIEEVAPYVKKSGLLMDLTSLKEIPMKRMQETKASYLGCHPMFGPTNSIGGQIIILCKGRGAKWHQWLKKLLQKNKVAVRELTAKKHDNLMAYTQALSHFTELVLADALRKSGMKINDFLKYQSPPYRLKLDMMGRILNQDPNLYAQIQIHNPKGLAAIQVLLDSTAEWTKIVASKNVKGFEKHFKKASSYLGNYKKLAMEESDFLIEQMNRKKIMDGVKFKQSKPDKSYDLVVLGPENTFSSMAAKDYNSKAKIWYADSISEVFDIVKKGVIKKGIVPIENKLAGTVTETSDNLFESNLKIQEEFNLSVHHFLASIDKIPLKNITTVYSHLQPLRQCRKYLKKNLPKAELIAMPSTTAALKKVESENLYDAAVICGEEAIKDFQMKVIANNIEDYKHNTTRFLVIGVETRRGASQDKTKKHKTSVAFYFSADAPGTLHQVLGEFAENKVNMTRIESSVNPTIPGGHVFYVDFEGSTNDLNVKKMLTRIKKLVEKLKILGCYEQL